MTEPDIARLPRNADDIRIRVRVAFGLLAAFGLFHAWASWGHAGPLWTEHGGWLHAIDRFAGGEAPYRDFEWVHPPLALWLLGIPARFTGAGLATISAMTVVIYLTVLALFFLIVQRLTREVALPITIATLLFATAYAARSGTPLPLGTGSVAIPVGVLFLLAAGLCVHSAIRDGSARAAAAAGGMAALTLMSAYQFWVAAVYLLVVGATLLRRADHRGASRAMAAGFAAVLSLSLVIVAASSGTGSVAGLLTGFGQLGPGLVASQPTVERLTIEVAAVTAITLTATSALWLCLAISDRTAGRWMSGALLVFLCAAAAHLGTTVAKGTQLTASGPELWPTNIEMSLTAALLSGRAIIPAALGILDQRFQTHLFPVLMPLFLLIVVWVRRDRWADRRLRNLVALLLGLCLSARASLGFRGSDWYNVLLEIPTYVLMLRLGGAGAIHQAGRAVLAALGVLVVLGLYAYATMARGPFTFRGVLEATATARGNVRWTGPDVRQYLDAARLLDAADPTRSRPMLAFGPTGRWNYFLGRRNPSPVREGLFLLGERAADSVIGNLASLQPAPLLLEHPFVLRSVPARIAPWRWETPMGPSPYHAMDRPRFERLLAACRLASAPDSTVLVRVFDCRR